MQEDDFILKVKCEKWLNGQERSNHTSLSKNLKNKIVIEKKDVIQSSHEHYSALST